MPHMTASPPPLVSRFEGIPFKPMKLCTYWQRDPATCKRGEACTFAHGEHELQSRAAEAAATVATVGRAPPGLDPSAGQRLAALSLSEVAPPGFGVAKRRFSPGKEPTKICKQWLQDPSSCGKGQICSFAHGVQELKPGYAAKSGVSRFHHRERPTSRCQFFAWGACAQDLACSFAHSDSELGLELD
mmetsp:Transcript_54668/g.107970  ORF Transcript_54668/g.107970 Transcript_54668/m.107970 type:complete len:187 (-) Transcript_54668:69-629(-)